MPYFFKLPTTSQIDLAKVFQSDTHPSLPFAVTAKRNKVRTALKIHKSLGSAPTVGSIRAVIDALTEYAPLAEALYDGMYGRPVSGVEVRVTPLGLKWSVEWRPTLSTTPPGRSEPARAVQRSYEYELLFVFSTLGMAYYLLARASLGDALDLSDPSLDSEARTASITTAMKHFITAHNIYSYVSDRVPPAGGPETYDISCAVVTCLSLLCLAEATLIAVLKDDPYSAAMTQTRNKNDKEWMYKAPTISKVRTQIFVRICVQASDHASEAFACLCVRSPKGDEPLFQYTNDLITAAIAKACRFLAIDAEAAGRVGEGIAWLRAAQKELGLARTETKDAEGSRLRLRLKKFKEERAERKEDEQLSRRGAWGNDAGRFDEARVVDALMEKWSKTNDTVNMQSVPAWEPLRANLPSGREFHTGLEMWTPPVLTVEALRRLEMRNPGGGGGGGGGEGGAGSSIPERGPMDVDSSD